MMPVPFLDAMAQAIYYNEGHQPGDRNHRNNNPGNLRLPVTPELPQDAGEYTVFPDFVTGYNALRDDIRAKITGHNQHGLGPESTLFDFFSVYAPAGDMNFPTHYASFVAWWLGKTYNQPFTMIYTFEQILALIGQTVE